MLNRSMPQVDSSRFAMVPRSDVPRSTFATEHSHKTTFQGGYLIPIYVDEVLPGDTHKGDGTVFARLATPLFPIMDNLCLETFFFFVPARLVWNNFRKFMGEQTQPSDSIAYLIPQIVSPAGGFAVSSIYDYFGLPTVGQVTAGLTVSINALPLRAYNLIYNEWFRDENINLSQYATINDGPDLSTSFSLQRRNKKHDYFTSCTPWPLKGGVDVPLPLGTSAPVVPSISHAIPTFWNAVSASSAGALRRSAVGANTAPFITNAGNATEQLGWDATNLVADLASATGSTINALRLAMTTQQLLEKDARGGTRYTELLRSHFGVAPEDARLQRPEYIGGGKINLTTAAIAQTSAQVASGPTVGTLGAAATAAGSVQFSYNATEHGYILGLTCLDAELTYQQGLRKMWARSTRYDFYWPAFANLGEQAVLNEEIYMVGTPAQDNGVFGYQERWAEYRYRPSLVTGLFRSTSVGTIDPWHLSQRFTALPTLNATFLASNPPLSRVLAAGAAADNQQILYDSVWSVKCTRPMPMYSVPGLTRF